MGGARNRCGCSRTREQGTRNFCLCSGVGSSTVLHTHVKVSKTKFSLQEALCRLLAVTMAAHSSAQTGHPLFSSLELVGEVAVRVRVV